MARAAAEARAKAVGGDAVAGVLTASRKLLSCDASLRGAAGSSRDASGFGSAPPLVWVATRPAASSTSATVTFPAIMSWTTTATPGGVLRVPLLHRLIFLSLVRNHCAAERCLILRLVSAAPNSVVAAARACRRRRPNML